MIEGLQIILQKAFRDKSILAVAFRRFLFESSPELKEIASKLSLQPELLNDKLHQVMQGAIYTWTEDQVREKLETVALEYRYLDTLNWVIGKDCHSAEEAQKELKNLFKFFRLSLEIVEKIDLPWFEALQVLHRVSIEGIIHLSFEEQKKEMDILHMYGKDAMGALKDAKPVLEQILVNRGLEYSQEELNSIYVGLKDLSCDSTINHFEVTLKSQISKISQARNQELLLYKWENLTGESTVKEWCVVHHAPIKWIIPKGYSKAIDTLIEVQQNGSTTDQQVVAAIELLNTLDVKVLTDEKTIENAMISTIGLEYREIWHSEKNGIISSARQKNGADMSQWDIQELNYVKEVLSRMLKEKAKKEKLQSAITSIKDMSESSIKERISVFLEKHPEYCDDFIG